MSGRAWSVVGHVQVSAATLTELESIQRFWFKRQARVQRIQIEGPRANIKEGQCDHVLEHTTRLRKQEGVVDQGDGEEEVVDQGDGEEEEVEAWGHQAVLLQVL